LGDTLQMTCATSTDLCPGIVRFGSLRVADLDTIPNRPYFSK
jgi:hypothetical protein